MCRKVMHRKSKGSLRSFSNYAGRSGFTSQPKEKLISSKSTGFFGLGNTCKYKLETEDGHHNNFTNI